MQCAPRKTFLHFLEIRFVHTARITAVPVIRLVFGLVAGHAKFRRIDHDDVVAGIDVRRVLWLVLATQAECDLASEAANDFVVTIN